MKDKQSFEDWLDDYRVKFYERTKGMSDDEVGDMVNRTTNEAAKKYGFKVIKSSPYVNMGEFNFNIKDKLNLL
jgi:hypothetical protein